MSKTAFLFPGQGSQTVGMGVDIAAESEAAADVLLRIDNALDEKLSLIMADGPADTLTLTQNAQPALYASSLGVLRAKPILVHRLARLQIMWLVILLVNIQRFARLAGRT